MRLVLASLILLACERPLALAEMPLSIGQAQLGNVFVTSQTVEIPVATTAERILWSVTDFFGVEVASGEARSHSGRASVITDLGAPGYFELELQARAADGGLFATALTTFAVVPAMDVTTLEDSRFGVMTHFAHGWDIDVVPLIARAGIRHVRDEQYWAQVEQRRGRYSFPERLTRYMAELARHDLEPLIVLSFANDLYDNGLTPFSDDGRAGYARYGRTVLDHYGGQIRAVEIWNEYNGSFCEGPCRDDRPGHYTRMLRRAYEELKRERPDITVLGSAAVNIPLPYLEAIFQAGGLDYMDAVAVHPYGSAPEDIATEIAALKQLMARHSGERPVWVTEIGRGSASPEGRRDAARYLVRMFTTLLSAGVERIYWYLLRDYQNFAGMGLLHGPDNELGRYVPTPAYAAYANLIYQLHAATFVRREPTDPRTHVHLFDRSSKQVRVAWSTQLTARLRLETDETLAIVDIMGRQTFLVPEGGGIDLLINDVPVYVIGNVRRIAEARRDELLADSVEGYSDQQGEAGWYYGYYHGGPGQGDGLDPGAYRDDHFEPLERVTDQWSQKWGDHRHPWLSIGPRNAHPSRAAGRPVWAVRRWVSNVSGRVRVSGRIAINKEKGDGVTARIFVDGRVIFAADLGGAEHPEAVSYELEVALANGSRVDFALGPGPQGDINFDSSAFTARITRDRP